MYPNLRLELWRQRIRQHELAKKLQMDETVLSKIVNGIRRPSLQLQRQIAVLLNRDEEWLFEAFQGAASPKNEKADRPQ